MTCQFVDQKSQQILFLFWFFGEECVNETERLCADVWQGIEREGL